GPKSTWFWNGAGGGWPSSAKLRPPPPFRGVSGLRSRIWGSARPGSWHRSPSRIPFERGSWSPPCARSWISWVVENTTGRKSRKRQGPVWILICRLAAAAATSPLEQPQDLLLRHLEQTPVVTEATRSARLEPHKPGDRPARPRDHDLLTLFDPLQEPGELRLRLANVHRDHGGEHRLSR